MRNKNSKKSEKPQAVQIRKKDPVTLYFWVLHERKEKDRFCKNKCKLNFATILNFMCGEEVMLRQTCNPEYFLVLEQAFQCRTMKLQKR